MVITLTPIGKIYKNDLGQHCMKSEYAVAARMVKEPFDLVELSDEEKEKIIRDYIKSITYNS